MHQFLENIVKTLLSLWMGDFKDFNSDGEAYVIPDHIWQQIGDETAAAVKNIPAAFCRVLGNIHNDRSSFTAESYSFWFIYIAPILLHGRFQHNKYYDHFLNLVKIMKTTLQFSVTHDEVDELEESLICWVMTYEK